MSAMYLHVPKALMGFLEGTQAYADFQQGKPGEGGDAEVVDLLAKVWPRRHKDGRVGNVLFTDDEVDLLLEYADYMVEANVDSGADGAVERRAGRKFIKTVHERRALREAKP